MNYMLTPLQGFGFFFGFAFLWITYAVYPYARRIVRFRPYKRLGSDPDARLVQQLATGCHMNAQFYLRWDTLRTGDSPRLGGLRDQWGIDGRQSALETLEWLRLEGHRSDMQAAVLAFADGAADASYLSKNSGRVVAIAEAFAFLKDNGLANVESDLKVGAAAWDYGRLVTVARWCYDAGHLSEAETGAYVETATAARRGEFASWRAYSLSYVLGRFLWLPSAAGNEALAEVTVQLLQDPRSPLATIEW